MDPQALVPLHVGDVHTQASQDIRGESSRASSSNQQPPNKRKHEPGSIDIISDPNHDVHQIAPTSASSNVHSHLLSFIASLNSAGRNMRSDCDDPDFKDADLVTAFHSKKAEICTPPSPLQQTGTPKISSSHIVCYQHQQARHTATDSVCEGRNIALHLPFFEGSAMTGFVEATWMRMNGGALQAACSPTGPFSKDKFPLCLSDWFVSAFKQVMLFQCEPTFAPFFSTRPCSLRPGARCRVRRVD
jgi:hypothetical protein